MKPMTGTDRAAGLMAALGIGAIAWLLRDANDIAVLIWNVAPYIVGAVACYGLRRKIPAVVGIVCMLVVDLWMMTETILGTSSQWSLALSVLSTLKLIVLFPIGFLGALLVMRISKAAQS